MTVEMKVCDAVDEALKEKREKQLHELGRQHGRCFVIGSDGVGDIYIIERMEWLAEQKRLCEAPKWRDLLIREEFWCTITPYEIRDGHWTAREYIAFQPEYMEGFVEGVVETWNEVE